METFGVKTSSRTEMQDITSQVAGAVNASGVDEGVCTVYVKHTTAGIFINENADPSVRADIAEAFEKLVPWRAGYSHTEGNSAAHIKSVMCGHSAAVPVSAGRLVLGTWQGIFFAEFDGPRRREVVVSVVPAG